MMPSKRRSSEENVKKRVKTNKLSSRDGSDKAINEDRSSKATTPPSKDPVVRPSNAKPAITVKPPKVFNLMSMIAGPKGASQSSSAKGALAPKETLSKSSHGPSKDVSSSSAEPDKSMAVEKAKIQNKDAEAAVLVLETRGSKAKIQDKGIEVMPTELAASDLKAKIQDKDGHEGAASGCLSSFEISELRQMAANLGPLSDRSGFQLPPEAHVQPREILDPSVGGELFLHSVFETMQEEFLPFDMTFDSVEVGEGSSLACDEVPANTFVMSAQATEPFVAAANKIRLPQVEDELILQGGDTLYKSLLSLQVKSLAITHASLRQYRELSRMNADRDSLRKDLSLLETKVKEKEEALALSDKRLADLSLEKDSLSQSAKDFESKVSLLNKQVEELDAALAKVRSENEDLRTKVDATDQELARFTVAERLRLAGICGHVCYALISVGSVPDELPEDASSEYLQAWLIANIRYLIQACKAFSNNVVHLAVRDLFFSLEAGGSDALAKAISDSFSFASTNTIPLSLVEALIKFGGHIDEAFWKRVLSIGRQPQSEDSFDLYLSEFATSKASLNVMPGEAIASESSSEVSLSEFAALEPPSHQVARGEPPITIFSSPSEIYLSSDSDPLSPIKGARSPLVFPLGSLVAICRFSRPDSDVSEGRKKRVKRGSRGGRSRGGPSSNRGSKKKRDGRGRRDPSIDLEGTSCSFNAASHVERMVSS
ncbi:hypothetical protein EJB05_49925, partial [Eragrostis curvula]